MRAGRKPASSVRLPGWKEENLIWIFEKNQNDVFVTLEEARETILRLCGSRLGEEALKELEGAKAGTFFRKEGSPLIKVVTEETGNYIRLRQRLGIKKKENSGNV